MAAALLPQTAGPPHPSSPPAVVPPPPHLSRNVSPGCQSCGHICSPPPRWPAVPHGASVHAARGRAPAEIEGHRGPPHVHMWHQLTPAVTLQTNPNPVGAKAQAATPMPAARAPAAAARAATGCQSAAPAPTWAAPASDAGWRSCLDPCAGQGRHVSCTARGPRQPPLHPLLGKRLGKRLGKAHFRGVLARPRQLCDTCQAIGPEHLARQHSVHALAHLAVRHLCLFVAKCMGDLRVAVYVGALVLEHFECPAPRDGRQCAR